MSRRCALEQSATDRRSCAHFSDEKIHEIIKRIDPSGQSLSVKETETDLKIFLKVRAARRFSPFASAAPRLQSQSGDIFDKGHGIRLLVEHGKCDLSDGTILVRKNRQF